MGCNNLIVPPLDTYSWHKSLPTRRRNNQCSRFTGINLHCINHTYTQPKSYELCITNIRGDILECMDDRHWNFHELSSVLNCAHISLTFQWIFKVSLTCCPTLSRKICVTFWLNTCIPTQISTIQLCKRKYIPQNNACINQIIPDSKLHGANMGPAWVLPAPDGPHVGPMNLAIRDAYLI